MMIPPKGGHHFELTEAQPNTMNNKDSFSELVLSELFEFAEAPSRDEFLDAFGYFTPVVSNQLSVNDWDQQAAIRFVILFISKNYAFRKYMCQFMALSSSYDKEVFCLEWQIKNAARGRLPIPSQQIDSVVTMFNNNVSQPFEILTVWCDMLASSE